MRDFVVRRLRQSVLDRFRGGSGKCVGRFRRHPSCGDNRRGSAGIATGDKSAAVDGAGNAFVVSEPTGKADPDYAAKKKAFDDIRRAAGAARREAGGLRRHVRIGTAPRGCSHRLPRAVRWAGFALLSWSGPPENAASHDAELRSACLPFWLTRRRFRVPVWCRRDQCGARESAARQRSTAHDR